jgi:hypothetical protein
LVNGAKAVELCNPEFVEVRPEVTVNDVAGVKAWLAAGELRHLDRE